MNRTLARILKLPFIFKRAPVIEKGNTVGKTQVKRAIVHEPSRRGVQGPASGGVQGQRPGGGPGDRTPEALGF